MAVLKALQKSYFGKVKMIYIDPPYNTGNDSFIYPDKFSETKYEYEKRVGDKDENGYMSKYGMFHKNSKENGQYHSNWLNMMYPRLFLAKNLLRQDGVIFISIDDNEVHNLRMVMNEVFGEENFVANIIWEKKYTRANDATWFSDNHDHILCFTKQKDLFKLNQLERSQKQLSAYRNPDKHPKGKWKATPLHAKSGTNTKSYKFSNGIIWSPSVGTYRRFNDESMQKMEDNNEIWFGADGNQIPQRKSFLVDIKEGVTPVTIWNYEDFGHNHEANDNIKELHLDGLFDNPKPVRLLKQMLKLGCNKDELILDFFAGSCTTAHAVMQLNAEDGGNRKYICIQLPELCDEKSEAYKAGYKTIAEIAKERIRRASQKIQKELEAENGKKKEKLAFEDTEETKPDLGFKVLKLADSNFKQWQQIEGQDVKALEKQIALFVDPVAKHATTENILYELLLKNGKNLNSKIEHKQNYHCINTNELIFMLEETNQNIISSVISEQPQKVIALDRLFKENDQLKTNTVLQMQDAGIEFKSI